MEASALRVGESPVRQRRSLPTPLMRLRSDEQLVHLFRAGNDDAFSVIHDRYRQRLFAYTRQMLPRHMDAEDALQDVFMRVYSSLRRPDPVLNLRPWLYRAAHNRCIDELRRHVPEPQDAMMEIAQPTQDPAARVEEREALRRILADVRRLPDQQRSALLLRELAGAHYVDIALALEVTVPAVKALLVRARVALATSAEARETACATIREELALAQDSGARLTATAKAHVRDCEGCREFRDHLRGTSKQLAALAPALGPLALVANALGLGAGGAGAAGGATAVGGGGAFASAGALTVGHGVTLIAAVVAAGGAIELQSTIGPSSPPSTNPPAISAAPAPPAVSPALPTRDSPQLIVPGPVFSAPLPGTPTAPAPPVAPAPPAPQPTAASTTGTATPPTVLPAVRIPTPIRQPSITGIGSVSTTSTSSIGRTSITGTASVSAKHPAPPAQSGGATGSPSSSSSTTAGTTDTTNSGTGSSSSAAPSGSGSPSDASSSGSGAGTDSSSSAQNANASTSSAPAQSSSATQSSSGWGTTSVAAVSS